MNTWRKYAAGLLVVGSMPCMTSAGVVINEIMYNPAGTDTDREWIEIFNTGTETVDVDGWKLYENDVNHGTSLMLGDTELLPGEYAIIADDTSTFLEEYPNFIGTVLKSSFSLNNTGEVLEIRNDDGSQIDVVEYANTMGASNNGNSLQKIDEFWYAGSPTPGIANDAEPYVEEAGEVDTNEVQEVTTDASPGVVQPVETFSNQSTTGSEAYGWNKYTELYARIFEGERYVVAGSPVVFEGQSMNQNYRKVSGKEIEYTWNFGDGAAYKKGDVVRHTYKKPGTYIVFVEAEHTNGDTARDKTVVQVIDINLEMNATEKGLTIVNPSQYELDISGWRVQGNEEKEKYEFLYGSFVAAQSRLELPLEYIGLSSQSLGEKIELRNPKNAVVTESVIEKWYPESMSVELREALQSNNFEVILWELDKILHPEPVNVDNT